MDERDQAQATVSAALQQTLQGQLSVERDALLTLVRKWCQKAKGYRDAHYNASVRLRRWHFVIGVPAIALSAIVGTTVFATLEKQVSFWVVIVVGTISVFAAVLAALQTFLRFPERAEAHRRASAEYENLAQRAELLVATNAFVTPDTENMAALRGACHELQPALASLAEKTPELSAVDRTMQDWRSSPGSSGQPALTKNAQRMDGEILKQLAAMRRRLPSSDPPESPAPPEASDLPRII
jgi:hypothetical protein